MQGRLFGPRFAAEALFLVIVAIVAGLAALPWLAIVLVMLLAYLLVVVFELAVVRAGAFPGQGLLRRAAPAPVPEPAPPAVDGAEPQHVRVIPREPEPAAQPVLERRPEREPAPEPEAPPAPEPAPPVVEPTLASPTPAPDRPLVQRPAEPVQPQREPEPVLAEAPPPEPEPEPVPQPVDAPVPLAAVPPPAAEVPPAPPAEEERVIRLPVAAGPREWNLWELERLVREQGGEDAVRDEERSYLLVYLREFATPEGTLPTDFDALVRESFGDLLARR